ncbi:MAG: BamA/TamA family outer membrane protein [Nitrospirota bacterium]
MNLDQGYAKKPILPPPAAVRALALAAILFLCASSAHAKFDPSFVWTTLETPHFLIHYHQGAEETAKRAAVIAEDVHSRLVPAIKWEPKEKTRLVLVDAMDEANGYTSPIPYNQVVLFLTQPSGGPGYGLTAYDDWLRLLITHEYTHVLQLDMVTGGPEALQKILGRIYFPNLFQPAWMIEGLATYEETEQTAGGRGRSPEAEMVIRTAALENAFPSLGQVSVFPDSWPSGQVPYLFGQAFTRYFEERYGREKLAEISTVYSGRWFPFLVTSTGRKVLSADYQDLWNEWQKGLEANYGKQRDELTAKGLTRSTPLTARGFMNTNPAYSPDGTRIAYAVGRGDEYPGIYLARPDGSGETKLTENVFPGSASGSSLAWDREGAKLYYTKIEITRNTGYYNDLYFHDVASAREVRLTKGLRARDPHPSPDGTRLLFVMNRMGMTRLAMLDLAKAGSGPATEKDITFLTPWGPEQYETPCFSPDGSRIAVGIWQPGGYRDIRLIDPSGSVLEDITHDKAIDVGPAWSRDGKYLYFSSDRSGIFNIYAYEPETKNLFQVTNVLGGAFSPAPSPDGKTLAFASYSSTGYDVHTMSLDREAWKPAEPYTDRYPSPSYAEKPVDASSRPYSALSTIYPRFWIPWFGSSGESGTLYGGLTFGQDAVQRHRYTASALYGPRNSRTWYGIDYFYDGLYPTLHLHASDNDITYGEFLHDARGSKDYVERNKTLGLALIVPIIKNAHQQALTIGYRRKELSRLTELPPWTGYAGPLPAEGDLVSGRLRYLYSSSRQYAYSISPEQGRTFELGAERFDYSLGSDFEFTKYTADWHEYVNLPWKHHVLLGRAFAGTSTGVAPTQGAYQLGGDNPGDITLGLSDRTVTLRGYPSNVLRGRKAVLGSMEYRFPITNLEKGWDTKPFYYRRFHGAFFFEAGNAWDGTYHEPDLRRSIGAEARLDMTLAYYLPLTIRFVVAKGLESDGESQAYFGLWVALEL